MEKMMEDQDIKANILQSVINRQLEEEQQQQQLTISNEENCPIVVVGEVCGCVFLNFEIVFVRLQKN